MLFRSDGEVVFEFGSNSNQYLSPKEILEDYIREDETILRKILGHSISRELIYDILIENGLAGNIIIEEVSITHKENFLSQKRLLNRMFPAVTIESDAKEDFVNIVSKDIVINS